MDKKKKKKQNNKKQCISIFQPTVILTFTKVDSFTAGLTDGSIQPFCEDPQIR